MDLKTTMRALKNDDDLCDLLSEGNKSIYHLKSQDAGSYPILIVSIISDVPITVSDNVETLHKITLRVHIVTDNGVYTNIYKRINNVLVNIGYNRMQNVELYEDDLYIKVCDYSIISEVTEV